MMGEAHYAERPPAPPKRRRRPPLTKAARRRARIERGKGRGHHRRRCDLQHEPFDIGDRTIKTAHIDLLQERGEA